MGNCGLLMENSMKMDNRQMKKSNMKYEEGRILHSGKFYVIFDVENKIKY